MFVEFVLNNTRHLYWPLVKTVFKNMKIHITMYYARYIITRTITAMVTNIPPNSIYLSWETLLSMREIVALDRPRVLARSINFLWAPFKVSLLYRNVSRMFEPVSTIK